jgi:DUF1680 family protein
VNDYPLQAVDFTDVKLQDSFWLPRLETNHKVTVPHTFHQSEITGRLDNFAKAAGLMEGDFEGLRFNDSDVYKIIEGASYSLALYPDPELDKYLDDLIAKIAAAQREDGYLFTPLIIDPENPPRGVAKERWVSERESHELYCVGHMYEAAVAHYKATGKRTLLDVAIKSADLVDSVFGAKKRRAAPGHQEIELGLVKLYRVTGEKRYLDLAKYFLDERGNTEGRESYGRYFQDHKPVLEQEEAVGHSVRAAYMYAAMADMAALTGNERYIQALDRFWENVAAKKLYITGGIGGGNSEGFSAEYVLPNMRAYNETCASIANALWNHRMFLLHGDSKYMDLVERIIYNGFLSGIHQSGDLFFYPNRLATVKGEERSPWFNCACCPSNVVRFLPQIAGFMYAQKENEIFVNLFVESSVSLALNENQVKIVQDTNYPWNETIFLKIEPDVPARFAIKLRIPGWTQNKPIDSPLYRYMTESTESATITVNGRKKDLKLDQGYATIERRWKKGDEIELHLPMPIRRVLTDEKVTYNRGRMALERGPLVYAAEWPDNNSTIHSLVVLDEATFETQEKLDLLGGVIAITGRVFSAEYRDDGRSLSPQPHTLTAIPYFTWAHRGPGPMIVWMAREPEVAWAKPAPTIAYESRIAASFQGPRGTEISALNDQVLPQSSVDREVPRFTWWDHKGTEEWVQYDFKTMKTVAAVEVYWFDDEPVDGGVRVPQSWKLFYKGQYGWTPVPNPSAFTIEKDRFNRLTFDPVTTKALRIVATLQPEFSAGILEWIVEESEESP